MTVKVKTKYGTAHGHRDGHLQIKTNEKGHVGEYVHRLVFEEFYQCKIPDDWVIHHEDGNPKNNEIWNLVPMTKGEHTALHSKGNTWSRGKYVPLETREKQSKAHQGKIIPITARKNRSKVTTTTGFLRVYTKRTKTTKQGFSWCYQYQDKTKKHNWSSVNLKTLKEKILSKGLEWEVIDEEKALKTCNEYGYDLKELY